MFLVYRWKWRKQHISRKYFLRWVPPAAITAAVDLSVKGVSVSLEEILTAAEDDDVVRGGGQGEEEHFELEAHAEEHSTGDEREDAAVNGVLQGMKNTSDM